MESSGDVIAQSAGVAADDAGSGGTAIDIDQVTRGTLLNLLNTHSYNSVQRTELCIHGLVMHVQRYY